MSETDLSTIKLLNIGVIFVFSSQDSGHGSDIMVSGQPPNNGQSGFALSRIKKNCGYGLGAVE